MIGQIPVGAGISLVSINKINHCKKSGFIIFNFFKRLHLLTIINIYQTAEAF